MLSKLVRLAAKMHWLSFVAIVADATNETVFERFPDKRSPATYFGKATVVVFGVLCRMIPVDHQLIERPFPEKSSIVVAGLETVNLGCIEEAELPSADARLVSGPVKLSREVSRSLCAA